VKIRDELLSLSSKLSDKKEIVIGGRELEQLQTNIEILPKK
jgi:hypothetical protein